jgi:hypothetical protein
MRDMSNIKRMISGKAIAVVLVLILGWSGSCLAEQTDGELRNILWATANYLEIDPMATLELLARVESDMNPLAIHLSARKPLDAALTRAGIPFNRYISKGRYHYSVSPENKEQAEALLIWASRNKSVSYDVGLMQIWRGNVERFNLDPTKLLEPKFNALIGGKIFKECMDRYQGDFWRSVECYHHGRYKGRTTYYSRNVFKTIQALLQEGRRNYN